MTVDSYLVRSFESIEATLPNYVIEAFQVLGGIEKTYEILNRLAIDFSIESIMVVYDMIPPNYK